MENTLNENQREIIANFCKRVEGVGLIEAIRNTNETELAFLIQTALESNKNLEDEIDKKQIMKIKTCEEYVLNELALAKNKIEELKKDNEQLHSFFQGTIEDLKKERDDLKERLDFFSKRIRHNTSEGNNFFNFDGYIWQTWNETDYNKLCEWLNIEQEEKSNE
jgi:FtsZ-binding cell division protein ZapB